MTRAIIGRGIVRLVQGDTAFIEVEDLDACVNCGAKALCGPGARKEGILRARNVLRATVGQRVGLAEYHSVLTKLSLIQFGIPMLGFFLGVLISYYSKLSIPSIADELVLFCFGLAGLLLGGAISWKWLLHASKMHTCFLNISVIYSEA